MFTVSAIAVGMGMGIFIGLALVYGISALLAGDDDG